MKATLKYSPRLATLSLGLILVATRSMAAEVWVVTDRTHPIHAPSGCRVIELDEARRIEHELATRLPVDEVRAAAVVRRRMDHGGRDLQRRLAAAYQGIVDAWSAGAIKIPAVIVDRRYIVYGERDVERAIQEIERYRSATP